MWNFISVFFMSFLSINKTWVINVVFLLYLKLKPWSKSKSFSLWDIYYCFLDHFIFARFWSLFLSVVVFSTWGPTMMPQFVGEWTNSRSLLCMDRYYHSINYSLVFEMIFHRLISLWSTILRLQITFTRLKWSVFLYNLEALSFCLV